MSDDDDMDFTSTNQSSKNLASLFQTGEPRAPATAAYTPPKQPKKDSQPKIMIATAVQAYSLGIDQKWTARGKLGVAILSTDNTVFQLILYLSKTQQITSARINNSTAFTSQTNNYLSFQDDSAENWSIMFENKQALINFVLQILLAKAYLMGFKHDHIIQDIRDGEGASLGDNEGVEITFIAYQLNDKGTIVPVDNPDNKAVRLKIGKQQYGKEFDDSLRGMKKNGQRLTLIGTTFYNIEVIRVKREKEVRSGSITIVPPEEQPVIERKRTVTEDNETNNEKSKMLQRINKMGGISMLPQQNQSSAFTTPAASQLPSIHDDDSFQNEFAPTVVAPRPISAQPPPPVQFITPTYHHQQQQQHHPLNVPQMPLAPIYSGQQVLHEYNSRPGSSMSAMGYQQMPMWSPSHQYPQSAQNVPMTDTFHQQQYFQNDFRQSFNRLIEKIDLLNDKIDNKNSATYPNMETSILFSNIQRIIKENENMKKDLFDRSAKVEELNLKISELLDRNQKLIEQTHQTAEQRNVVVNNVSEQTAQKILDLERQKVELTNNLSLSTSKIAELQLQINQYTHDNNDNQSRVSSLLNKCEQYKADLHKSENERSEIQIKFDSIQEQYKNEKSIRKQLETKYNTLEEEFNEFKVNYANLEKIINERKAKYENERKRWQDDMDEQKQSYEKELDDLRTKLRKQRTADNQTNNQEIHRIEQDLEKQWQEKLERQQTQYERTLALKTKEFEQLNAFSRENEIKLNENIEELKKSKEIAETYQQRCNKLQEHLTSLKEEITEIKNEQTQLVHDEIKLAINIIYKRLKTRIQPTKQYTGEQFLSRSLEIIKKATLKVLSNNTEDDEEEEDDDGEQESDEDNEDKQVEEKEEIRTNVSSEKIDEPTNGNSIDENTLNEEISAGSLDKNEENRTDKSEITQSISQKNNGWDTVDDLPSENQIQISSTDEQIQNVSVQEETSSPAVVEIESKPSTNFDSENIEQEQKNETAQATTDENNYREEPPDLDLSKEKNSNDDDDDSELFGSGGSPIKNSVASTVTQPTPSSTTPRYKFNENIPLMNNPDDSEDELFK